MKFLKSYFIPFFLWIGVHTCFASLLDSPYQWLGTPQAEVNVGRVLQIMKQANAKTFRDQVNYIRSFIIENSSFGSSSQKGFEYYFNRPNEALTAILAHYDDKSKPKPPMECYSRTRLIMGLLARQGIMARRLILFSDRETILTSHTLFEIHNPDTQKWEVHDSNGDAYYMKGKKQVLSMEDLLFCDLSQVMPCQTPQKCGWKHFPGLKEGIERFGVILYDYSYDGQPDRIIINKRKFDVQKKFQASHYFHSAKNRAPATFMEVIKDWWISHGNPVVEER